MDNKYVLISIGIMSLVTILLRFIPFIFLNDKKDYKLLNYLSKVLPPAIMGMLVVYCLRDVNFLSLESFVPAFIASGTVVLVHLWKRKTLLSILSGNVVYMILLQMIFN